MKIHKKILAFMAGVAFFAFLPVKAQATAQWARKYNTSCSTCHTVFPRLNYYGEKFMRNGFQDPDDALDDGDTKGKKEYDRLFIGKLEDYLGVRIALQPIKVKTNGLTKNGKTEPSLDIGKGNWIQFFAAGSIAKNISFFNELEFNDSGTVKHGWFKFGAHNVIGKRGLVNFQIGKISPVEWTSFSNRLRIFPEIQGFADKVNVSGSAAAGVSQDSINISSGQWGINYYGYTGPLIWLLGVGNSKNATDVNQQKNFWGSLRYDITNGESQFEGSSVSMFGYRGTDTTATATAEISNNYWRLQPSFNLRWKNWVDLIGSFHLAKEDNVALTAASPDERYWGVTGILSFLWWDKFQTGLQYDTVRQKNAANLEDDRLAVHASYLLRDNINLILTADTDLPKSGLKNHEFFATIRSMW